jgi:hypothetical protein
MAENWWDADVKAGETTEVEPTKNWWDADVKAGETAEEEKPEPVVKTTTKPVVEETIKLNPEVEKYAKELIQIQGGYEYEDLEAAGFSDADINAFQTSINVPLNQTKAQGDGSELYMGVPGTDMYDGYKMGYKDDSFETKEPDAEVTAFEIYNAYADNENTVVDTLSGNLIYNDPVSGKSFIVYFPSRAGTSVPIIQDVWNEAVRFLRPDYYAEKPAGVNEGTRLINEISDSATNTIEFAAAVVDTVADKVFDKDTSLVEWSNTIPRTSSGFSKFDAITGEGAGLAASFFTGKIAVDAAVEGGSRILAKRFMSPSSSTSKWMKLGQPVIDQVAEPTIKLLRYSGGEFGVAAGADTDTQTIFKPFGVDPKDPDAKQILAARMNIFVDSLILSGALDTAARVGLKTVDFVNQASVGALARSLFQSADAKKASAMENILADLSAVQAESTRQEIDTARKKLVETIRRNKTLLIDETKARVPENELVLDVFSALEADEAVTPKTLARIQQLRSGIISDPKNRGALNQASTNVNVQTDRILQEEATAALPKGATMEQATDTILGSNQTRLLAQQKKIFEAQEAIKTADEATINSILSDPTLSPALNRLQNVSSSEVSALSVDKKREIARTLIDEAERMTAQKNALFDAIPEGANFDYAAFGDLIEQLSKETDQFGTEGAEFLNKRLIATIKAAYKKTSPESVTSSSTVLDASGLPMATVPMSAKELAEELVGEGVDFKRLYNDIRPAIADLASEAFDNNRAIVGGKLRQVVKFIDDQVEFVAKNNPAAEAAANDAMNYYKKEFIPLWGDNPLKDTFTTFTQTRARNITPVKEVVESQAQVVNVLEQGAAEEVNQLVKVLEVSDMGASPETVQEYLTARIFEDLYAEVSSKGLQNINPATLSSSIRAYSDQLRGNFDTLAMELDSLEARILSAKDNGIEVSDILKQAQEQFETMKTDSFSKMIGGLVNKYSPGTPSGNVENKLTALMNTKDGADGIAQILKETDNNPIVVGGLKKLYLEELRAKAFNIASETSTGAPIASVAKIRNVLAENADLAATGNVILKDDPELAAVLKTLLTSASDAAARRNAKALPASSGTPEIQQYQNAINTMINVIVGPLNRIGTQARTAGRIAAEKLDIANQYAIAMDAVVADAPKAMALIDKLERLRATKGIGPIRIPKDLYDELFSLGIRIGRYAEADRRDAYETWDQSLVNAAVTVDDAVSDTRSFIEKTTDQTQNMLKRAFPAITQ